ncbi:MAG: hypothetical protein PHV16_02725 [Candidatus Nanoarchaeia archaeon]|nr:hypothetical protein [Candidatus Nanoarchaeia archaeon]
MIKKEYIWLGVIFAFVLGLRLYFAFQTPYFSEDAYFNIRQVEHITKTGLPLFKDELSYGGRNFLFQPLFQYILAFFNLFMPLTLVCKLIPNIFASSLVFITYMIVLRLTKNKTAALFSSFISGFIPIYFGSTINSVSAYSFVIPLIFFIIYFFFMIKKDEKYINYLILSIFLLALTNSSVVIFILAFIIYLLLVKFEHLPIRKQEVEIIIFSSMLILWLNFIIYKNAFLLHGYHLVWQNIPSEILGKYFYQFSIIDAVYYIGVIPILLGFIVIYRYTFKKKSRYVYFLMGFALSSLFLLWFKLIQIDTGLMFLGVILVLLFGKYYPELTSFIEKTRISRFKKAIIAFIFVIFLINSVLPSITYASKVTQNLLSKTEMNAFLWLKENTEKDVVILGSLDEGYIINAVAERKNFFDRNFMLIENTDQRLNEAKKIYTTSYETEAIPLLNKYNIKYIIISKKVMDDYGITDLNYKSDEKCFEVVYNQGTKIYKSLCRMD